MLCEVTNDDAPEGGGILPGSIAASTEVATEPSGRRFVGAAVLVLLVSVGWSVLSSTDRVDQAAEADLNNVTADEVRDKNDGQALSEGEERGQPVEEAIAETIVLDRERLDQAEYDESIRSAADSEGAFFGSFVVVDPAGQPADPSVVASLDFALLVKTAEGWFLVDPQSGESQFFESELKGVRFVTETHLVGSGETGMFAIPLADMRATPVPLDTGIGGAEVWKTEDPDRILVGVWNSEGRSESFFDLNTGEGTSIEGAGSLALTQRVGNSNLVSSRGSGVFEETNGTYRRISDGWGITANSHEVLVHRCDAQLECENVWLDRASGEALGYPSPEIDGLGLWGVGISDDGRWLFEAVNGPLAISEIETGRQVNLDRFEIPWGDPGHQQRFDLSSDESWLVFASPLGETVLVNLDDDSDYRLLGDERVEAVFVLPRSSFG